MPKIKCCNVCPQGGSNHLVDLERMECFHPHHEDEDEDT